jgi:hypothetical protein
MNPVKISGQFRSLGRPARPRMGAAAGTNGFSSKFNWFCFQTCALSFGNLAAGVKKCYFTLEETTFSIVETAL